jgi:hypothetical protein
VSQRRGEAADEEVVSVERRRLPVEVVNRREVQPVFEAPNKPTNPDTHSPQVPTIDPHRSRFNDTHKLNGADEQSTSFSTLVPTAMAVLKSSKLWLDVDSFKESDTYSRNRDRDKTLVFTITLHDDKEDESKLSNTRDTVHNDWFESRAPEGRVVEVYESSILDLNTTNPRRDEDDWDEE